jgi:hypothetical protein
MNNSKIAIDKFSLEEEKPVDRTPWLREREGELIKIIEALNEIEESKPWSTLKNTVFDGVVETLERQLKVEASKDDPNTLVLSKINGQLVWARKYANLKDLSNVFRTELTNIRKQLHENT